MTKLLDYHGNPIQLRRLYEDRGCQIYVDWCFVWNFSEEKGEISFAYYDGRIKTFPLAEASQFARGLRILVEENQRNFESIRLRVKGLAKIVN